MNFIIGSLKFFAASSGPVCIFYAIKRFEKYHAEGKDIPDKLYNVAMSNHGVSRYITEEQSWNFHFFLGFGVFLSVGLIGVLIFKKIKEGR